MPPVRTGFCRTRPLIVFDILESMKNLLSSAVFPTLLAVGCLAAVASARAADAFTLQNIGNPSIAGASTPAPGGFDLSAGGSDIGGSGSDQFSFEYVQRSGDFDVQVRLAGMTLSDAWAKAGLMAREDLNATNRFAATFATPSVSGCFFQYRLTNAQPAINTGQFPVTYPGTWLR